jgi:heme/copper-type cytochrome/quinol oxidase subunit 2
MFWVLSFIMNCTAFGFLIYYTDIKDLSTNLVMKLKYIITHCIFIIVSLILSVMVFKYQREHP